MRTQISTRFPFFPFMTGSSQIYLFAVTNSFLIVFAPNLACNLNFLFKTSLGYLFLEILHIIGSATNMLKRWNWWFDFQTLVKALVLMLCRRVCFGRQTLEYENKTFHPFSALWLTEHSEMHYLLWAPWLQGGKHERSCDAHFTNKKMKFRKVGDLPKVWQLASLQSSSPEMCILLGKVLFILRGQEMEGEVGL